MKIRSLALIVSTLLMAAPSFVSTARAEGKSSLNATDEKFVKKAAQDGMDEVKLAGLAVQKAERPDVKSFAEQLVKDHTAANDQLKALAATKGVELSAVIEPAAAKSFKSLEGESGASFDKAFIKDMVKDHKSCVSSFEKQQKDGTDGDLKAWVDKTLPTLREHLDKAKALNK